VLDSDGTVFWVTVASGGNSVWELSLAGLVPEAGRRELVRGKVLNALTAHYGRRIRKTSVSVGYKTRSYTGTVSRVKLTGRGCCAVVWYDVGGVEHAVSHSRIRRCDGGGEARTLLIELEAVAAVCEVTPNMITDSSDDLCHTSTSNSSPNSSAGDKAGTRILGTPDLEEFAKTIRPLLPLQYHHCASMIAKFCAFIYERQEIWRQKNRGISAPWTTDSLLSAYAFCNVYRELDRGTVFFRSAVAAFLPTPWHFSREREQRLRALTVTCIVGGRPLVPENAPAAQPTPICTFTSCASVSIMQRVLWASLVYRLLNKIESFWGHGIPTVEKWPAFKQHLCTLRREGKSIFSNAHQTMGLDRYVQSLDAVAVMLPSLAGSLEGADPEQAVRVLTTRVENVGVFFAWQVVCDLLETNCLDSSGENQWVALGPGAKRGLGLIFTEPTSASTGNQKERVRGGKGGNIAKCRFLADVAPAAFYRLGLPFYYIRGRQLTLKNIEHCLCEFAKYESNMSGGRYFRSRACALDGGLVCVKCNDIEGAKDGCLLFCDLCNMAIHSTCLEPPITEVPETEWFCAVCNANWDATTRILNSS